MRAEGARLLGLIWSFGLVLVLNEGSQDIKLCKVEFLFGNDGLGVV